MSKSFEAGKLGSLGTWDLGILGPWDHGIKKVWILHNITSGPFFFSIDVEKLQLETLVLFPGKGCLKV